MAKRQKAHQVAASFHFLVKSMSDDNGNPPIEGGFTPEEYNRVVRFIMQNQRINVRDPDVIELIKTGRLLPFGEVLEIEPGIFAGEFEGAYYGQKYRNNFVGEIDPESLNLRKFFYIICRMRDGKIIIGVTYHGLFGDYDGIRTCFSHILRGDYEVKSKTLKIMADEIGAGEPVEVRVIYRKAANRVERRPFFGVSGAIVVKKNEFGEGFADKVGQITAQVQGEKGNRQRALARLIQEDGVIELDDEDIVGCSAIVRENGRQRTVYILGENSQSTKIPLNIDVNDDGIPTFREAAQALIDAMREKIIPLIV